MKKARPRVKEVVEQNANETTVKNNTITTLSTREGDSLGEGDSGDSGNNDGNSGNDNNNNNNNNGNTGGRPKPPIGPGTILTPPDNGSNSGN